MTRTIVHLGVVGRVDPIADVPVALLRGVAGSYVPAGIVVATDADGRFSHTLAGSPSQPRFSAVASAPAAGVPPTYATCRSPDARRS